MLRTRHLTNNEIIAYTGRNQNTLTAEALDRIRKHLEEPCESCMEKIESLKRFNHSFHAFMESNEEPEKINTCPFAKRIEALSNGEADDMERKQVIEHLASCDDCREYLSVLTECREIAGETADIGNEIRELWINVKEGILRLADNLKLAFTSGQVFKPAYSAIVYRDSATGNEPQNTDPVSVDLVLPNQIGTIRLLRVILKNGMNRISVKPLEVTDKIKLIEILDTQGKLLKSVDTAETVSCTVSGTGCLIVINRCIEVPVDF